MSGKNELNDAALDAVTGGTTAAPTPTGAVAYKCPKCGTAINASTRDQTVTCPNVRCRCAFQVRNGALVQQSSGLRPVGL